MPKIAPLAGARGLVTLLKERGHTVVITGGYSEAELVDAGAIAVFPSLEAHDRAPRRDAARPPCLTADILSGARWP